MSSARTILAAILAFTTFRPEAIAQVAPPVILEVDLDNVVQYIDDTTDFAKLGSVSGPTAGGASLNFRKFIILADIVAVNGKPAKGLLIENARAITLRPAPTPGQAISDVTRNNLNEFAFEILTAEGVSVGSIVGIGIGNGPAPPGAPLMITQGNNPITGGTGAFVGVHGVMGQFTSAALTSTQRVASMAEDPANRRMNGGSAQKFFLHIIPATRPEIVNNGSGPAVFHADFSPVTSDKPAKAGEVLIVRATGLGPTVPGVNPGDRFPADTPQLVNSPVQVTIGGQVAPVINAIGWPGLLDTYRIDARVPDGVASGSSVLQLTVAWIPGTPVSLPTQ